MRGRERQGPCIRSKRALLVPMHVGAVTADHPLDEVPAAEVAGQTPSSEVGGDLVAPKPDVLPDVHLRKATPNTQHTARSTQTHGTQTQHTAHST